MHRLLLLSLIIGALLLGACAGTAQPMPSGFLGPAEAYTKLRKVDKGFFAFGRSSTFGWFDSTANWQTYHAVLIEPVKVDLAGAQAAPEVLEKLQNLFYTSMAEALSENFRLVNQPGAGVLVFQICLTSLSPADVRRNIGLGVAGLVVPGTSIFEKNGIATMEAKLLDGATRRSVIEVMDLKEGGFTGLRSLADSYQEWGDVESSLKLWAKGFNKALHNFQHGKPVKYLK